ncbi:hypothetical protein [Actinomadura rupiterrae]|uniref:hypothetical protein n=1 Tax=Actinomadura rupiterrae TaxID=559627 RepID=UPI0020A53E0D|nr:hypothetical protein [Actinomadura rupiterrae]MCP2337465.1 hypothetical protein [Actinomadura rupiterrae]
MMKTVLTAGASLACAAAPLSGCAHGSASTKPVGIVTVDSHRRCKPGSPIGQWQGRPEIQGSAHNATLWALTDQVPLKPGRDVRLLVRMTGQGALRVQTRGPGRSELPPASGPSQGNIPYDRPGDGWTMTYRFPSAGCWHIKFHRSLSWGSLWLSVR